MSGSRIGLRDVQVKKGRRTILDIERLDVRGGEVLAVGGPESAGTRKVVRGAALRGQSAPRRGVACSPRGLLRGCLPGANEVPRAPTPPPQATA